MTPSIAIVGGGPAGLSLGAVLESKGIKDYIIYEKSAPETVPRGSCLDLHAGSGQKVFKDIGAFPELEHAGRWGEATIHYIVNHHMDRLHQFGEGRDAPEVDRWDIRRILLNHIPSEKVRFRAGVDRAYRDGNGRVTLQLTNGETVSGFNVVIGADGAFSKIRPLVGFVNHIARDFRLTRAQVTSAELHYTGHISISTRISPSNPYYDKAVSDFTISNYAVCGLGNLIWSAPQNNGDLAMELILEVPETFPAGAEIDLTDSEANKEFMLKDQHFGQYAPQVHEAIRASEGPWRPWGLYHMPVDCFNWECQGDVTLIGDAAHATTPWAGDGVNCSMRDALILARTLSEMGTTEQAIAQYEKEMFVWAADLISRCVASEKLFLDKDGPEKMVKVFSTQMDQLIGGTDDV